MPRTYAKNLVHCVYGTKNAVNLIRNPQHVWHITREIARNIDIDIIAIGGITNHVHLLMSLPPSRAMSNIVRDLKANSSQILRHADRRFRWQDGYAVISVSPSSVAAVVRYIEHQAEHHKARSFAAEYIAMLERAGIAYDAKSDPCPARASNLLC
jgi:putative transposase